MREVDGLSSGFRHAAALALALALGLTVAEGSPLRAVAVRDAEDRVEVITEDGLRYRALGTPIPASLLGQELWLSARPEAPPPAQELPGLVVTGGQPPPESPPPFFEPLPPKTYADTERVLPEAEQQPGARIEIELPELGRSAASNGENPIRMLVDLPRNYRRETAHPVIVHFGGGRGSTRGVLRWRQVVGADNIILVGADYDHHENERRGLLEIGTCRDEGSRIARHALQILGNSTRIDTNTIILAGVSSGAYSVTDNLTTRRAPWEPFAGFCAINGGAETGVPRLDGRPVLLIMGENDTAARHGWRRDAEATLTRARANLTVRLVPGVGHNWGAALDAPMREWLTGAFPALAAVERRRALLEAPLPPEARAVIAEWIRRSGLE